MAQRMGTALLTVIREGESGLDAVAGEAGLRSQRRARLFRFFCLHPVAVVAEAARATDMAVGTLRWHGAKLVETGWLELCGSTYYPRGLVDAADLPILEALGAVAARRTLASVFEIPGQSVSELGHAVGLTRQATARFVDDFRSVGLVSAVEDGAFVRVYATRLLAGRREDSGDRVRAFCNDVLRRLNTEGLAPEVLRRTSSEFLLRYGLPGRRVVLNLPIDPFSSALLE